MKNGGFAAAVLAAAIASAFAGPASADPPAPPPAPLADYLRLPEYFSPRLSPDGNHLVVATPVHGRLNLAVVDLRTRKATALTNFDKLDVVSAVWIGNERIVFSLGQVDAPSGFGQGDGGGLFVISRDGSESRVLAPTAGMRERPANEVRGMSLVGRIQGNDDEVLVSGSLRSGDSEDVYRLDLRSGRVTLITVDRPSRTFDFVLDHDLVPRIAVSRAGDSLGEAIWYRANAAAPWAQIAGTGAETKGSFVPITFLADNKTLLVAARKGRDTRAIYRYDPESRSLGELVAQHPRYDLGASSLILEPGSERVLGYRVDAERPVVTWIDERSAQTQAVLDRALPDLVNVFSRFASSSRVLVSSYSATSPAKYYLFDEDKKTLEELFASRPWLGPERLVEMRPFVLKTRDGLLIPSYYFLPKGYKEGDRLPTIVHIHGGPEVRADRYASGYGYQEAELLASRGYAVVLPNFRITPGLGARVHDAGYGTVGRQMSEDHEDAAKWAIAQGFADPQRMCIVGASYGGYATLMALAKTPELFKCGVAGLPVADWEMLLSSPISANAYGTGPRYFKRLLGASKDASPLRDYSPVNLAARITAPVFLWEGTDDIVTPVEQTRAMAKALDQAGHPAKTVLIKVDEGHGFGRLENRIDLYEKVLRFLGDNIGTPSR